MIAAQALALTLLDRKIWKPNFFFKSYLYKKEEVFFGELVAKTEVMIVAIKSGSSRWSQRCNGA